MFSDHERTVSLMFLRDLMVETGRDTKELSKNLSRTESRILSALTRLGKFLLNPLIQGHSGSAPKTSLNTLGTNQGAIEDNSQRHPHPEASLSQSQTTRNFGPKRGRDMVTGFQEGVIDCTPGTSSGRQKKYPSASKPEFRSKNTPATIGADPFLLAF